MIRNIVMYLERSYIMHHPGYQSFMKAGLTFFKNIVIKQGEIEARLTRNLLQLIDMDR
jgi:hypothetical protein